MPFEFAGRYGPEPLFNEARQLLADRPVGVYLVGTATLASLYTDRTKATAASNPVDTDEYGNLAFFADPGDYDIKLTDGTPQDPLTITVPVDQVEADSSVFVAAVAAAIPLIARGAAGQTASLQEWQDSDGTRVAVMSATGSFEMQRHFNCVAPDPGDYAAIVAYAGADSNDPAVRELAMVASESLELMSLASNSATGVIFPLVLQADPRLGENNQIWLGTDLDFGKVGFKTDDPQGQVHVKSRLATIPTLIAQGAAAQTANLQEWRNSVGAALASIDSLGRLTTPLVIFDANSYLGTTPFGGPTFVLDAGGDQIGYDRAANILYTYIGGVPVVTVSAAETLYAGNLRSTGKMYPGSPAGVGQASAGICAGTGAPNNANGANGDVYVRGDGGALTTIYQRRAGAWVGIV